MKNTPPSTVRLTAKAAQALGQLQHLKPGVSQSQIVQRALEGALTQVDAPEFSREELGRTEVFTKYLGRLAEIYTSGKLKDAPNAGSMALAAQETHKVLTKVLRFAKAHFSEHP